MNLFVCRVVFCFSILAGIESATAFAQPDIGARRDLGALSSSLLREVSGVAPSRLHEGMLWVHNDSGDRSVCYGVDLQGNLLTVLEIENAQNRDWEDMATGILPDSKTACIFIGDIGDNSAQYDQKIIYRFAEPLSLKQSDTLRTAEKITVAYPDGKRDAETLLYDPISGDLFIVSKREAQVQVYRAPYPQSTSAAILLEKTATLPYTQIVGGDISSDGREILLKTYTAVYWYERKPGESIAQALGRPGLALPYTVEPQGEAVCFSANNNGYFTVSEESPLSITPHVYFYPKILSGSAPDSLHNAQNIPTITALPNALLVDMSGMELLDGETASIDIFSVNGKKCSSGLLNLANSSKRAVCSFSEPPGVYLIAIKGTIIRAMMKYMHCPDY